MTNWLSGVRGTVAVIVMWTLGWGLGFGGLIEAFVDPHGEIVDIWFTVMAIPGFVGGLLYAALLRIAEGRRPLDEVSRARAATWGALTGFLLGVVVAATRAAGTMSPVAAVSIMTALGGVAGAGSALGFRLAARVGARRQRAGV
jgi:hypothetical protein